MRLNFSFSAKVDVLLKHLVELKEELRESKEIIRNLRREHDPINMISTESFKTLENLQDMNDFEEKLKIEDEFAKAVCSFFFYLSPYMHNYFKNTIYCTY